MDGQYYRKECDLVDRPVPQLLGQPGVPAIGVAPVGPTDGLEEGGLFAGTRLGDLVARPWRPRACYR